MNVSLERLLNVRAAFGASFDASGRRLYFLSTLSGVPGVWGLPLDCPDAWPEPLAVGPERVQYAHPAPRPGRLVFGLDRGGNERTQLHLLDGPGARPRALTEAPGTIHHFGDWDRAGRMICYAANPRDPRFFDLYVRDVESGEARCVYRDDANNRAVGFDPNGRRVAVVRIHVPFEHEVLLADAVDGSVRSLTAGAPLGRYLGLQWAPDGSALYCTTDRGGETLAVVAIDPESGRARTLAEHPWDVEDLAVSPDGRRLAYSINEAGYSRAFLLDLLDGSRRELVGPPGGLCHDAGRWEPTFGWSPDGGQLALTFGSATRPPDVWLADVASGRARQVTRSWQAEVAAGALVEPELVHYPSFDGREIPAFLFHPRGGPLQAGRPALFYVHGGPESQLRPSFNPIIQYFVGRGFLVVAPNVRGSSGYGKTYCHLDDVERRPDAVRDLAAGAEWLAERGVARRGRLALMGASYGGYMVLAALTERPDLWAAGVDLVGIANFVTFLERTGPWRRRQREAEYGSLEHHRDLLERLSPIHRADRIAAPLMVVHGANDPRVPVSEAEQIVATLRSLGRPVEYLRFEDEGHGLVKLANRLAAYPRIADFLERHLLGRGAVA